MEKEELKVFAKFLIKDADIAWKYILNNKDLNDFNEIDIESERKKFLVGYVMGLRSIGLLSHFFNQGMSIEDIVNS